MGKNATKTLKKYEIYEVTLTYFCQKYQTWKDHSILDSDSAPWFSFGCKNPMPTIPVNWHSGSHIPRFHQHNEQVYLMPLPRVPVLALNTNWHSLRTSWLMAGEESLRRPRRASGTFTNLPNCHSTSKHSFCIHRHLSRALKSSLKPSLSSLYLPLIFHYNQQL